MSILLLYHVGISSVGPDVSGFCEVCMQIVWSTKENKKMWQLAPCSQTHLPLPTHSLALNRFKEFLNSNLLYGMYSDAVASGSLDFATSEQPQSFVKLQSFLQAPVHISRVDAFTHVQLALGKAVCRFVISTLFSLAGLRGKGGRISGLVREDSEEGLSS